MQLRLELAHRTGQADGNLVVLVSYDVVEQKICLQTRIARSQIHLVCCACERGQR